MTEHVLVLFEGNWADEMDIKGFQIVEKEWWNRYVEKMPDEPMTFYVGSNQELEYSNKQEFLQNFTVKEVTAEEIETIKKFFPYGRFGKFVWNEDFDMDD